MSKNALLPRQCKPIAIFYCRGAACLAPAKIQHCASDVKSILLFFYEWYRENDLPFNDGFHNLSPQIFY